LILTKEIAIADMTVPGSMEVEVTPELVRSIAELAGISLLPQDVEALVSVMTNQIAMAARLRPLEFDDVPPITGFDPRWR
jgi:hypothetical protein